MARRPRARLRQADRRRPRARVEPRRSVRSSRWSGRGGGPRPGCCAAPHSRFWGRPRMDGPHVGTIGVLLGWLWAAILVQLVLTFPEGRPWTTPRLGRRPCRLRGRGRRAGRRRVLVRRRTRRSTCAGVRRPRRRRGRAAASFAPRLLRCRALGDAHRRRSSSLQPSRPRRQSDSSAGSSPPTRARRR